MPDSDWMRRAAGPLLAVLALGLVGAKGASAQATCTSVAASGDNLQAFTDSLAPGQTGCLRAGTHEFDELIVRSPGITLTSYPGERARLLGRLWIAQEGDGVTVSDLDLDGRSPWPDSASPTVTADDVTFRNNDVTNANTAICFVLGSSSHGRARRTLIEGNRIHDCGKLPAANHDHGIYVEAANDAVIRDNWIYDNADRGIQLYPDARRTKITGNVIDGNGQGLIFGGDRNSASRGTVVTRNIITNSQVRHNVESSFAEGGPIGRRNVVRNNCIAGANGWYDDGNGSAVQDPEIGFDASSNVVADPMYENPEAGDFDLAPESPCSALGERIVLTEATEGPGAVQVSGVIPGPLGDGQRVRIQGRRHGRWHTVAVRRVGDPEFRLRVRKAGGRKLRARSAGRLASRPVGLKAR